MKKRSLVLSIMLLAVVGFVSPLKTKAETLGLIFGSTDMNFTSTMLNADETAVTGSITVENKGENSKAYIGIKAIADIPARTSFVATMNLTESNWKFTKANPCQSITGSGWSVTCKKVSDTSVELTVTATTAMAASAKKIISEVTLDGSAGVSTEGCRITLSTGGVTPPTPTPENPKCKIEGGKHYCANGEECTEEEYNKICTTTENPQTGSFIPYAVIVGGLVVAAGLYMVTKKNKIYHM